MTFSKCNASVHLPTAVWDTVNDQVPPREDEGEEEQDKQQTEEDKRGAAALEPGITVPASGVRMGEQPAEPLALPTPATLEPPRGMRITAAFHRPVETRANVDTGCFPQALLALGTYVLV